MSFDDCSKCPCRDACENEDGCLCDLCVDRECENADRCDSCYDEDEDYLIDGVGFADPGGNSALRAETPENPRNLPCPTCGRENMLTPLDKARGYQCDACADQAERGW
jgi:hypothetical protein